MDSESFISKSTDKIIDTQLSLKEVLGEDWKQKCIFNSPEKAFTSEELTAYQNGRIVTPEQIQTETELFAVKANRIFEANQSSYKALVIEIDNRQEVLITGRVGADTIYCTSSCLTPTDSETIIWGAEKFGIMTEDQKIFSIDELVHNTKNGSGDDNMVFIEKLGRKTRVNCMVDNSGFGTATLLPDDYSEMGVVAHELGHLIQDRYLKTDLAQRMAIAESHHIFQTIDNTNNPFIEENAALNNYQVRQMKAYRERGAWALGISIFKEVGQEIGMYCGSKPAVNRMLERSEASLSTYDEVPHVLEGQPEEKLIPVFSQKEKQATREVHTLRKQANVKYRELPNFDQMTGKNIANKPSELLKHIKTDTTKKPAI